MLYRKYIKRLLDIVFSFLALAVLWPFFLLIILIIRLGSPGKVIFTQQRAGWHKQSFTIYKFRTMYKDSPDNVATSELVNPYRYITHTGRFFRKTGLDELPQLFNILRGDMSFVGPRPLVWSESGIIEERERLGVYDVRPGLTGWAQVNGRDEIIGRQKGSLDAEYVEKMSFLFDLKCLFMTFSTVLLSKGFREGKKEDQPAREDSTVQV